MLGVAPDILVPLLVREDITWRFMSASWEWALRRKRSRFPRFRHSGAILFGTAARSIYIWYFYYTDVSLHRWSSANRNGYRAGLDALQKTSSLKT